MARPGDGIAQRTKGRLLGLLRFGFRALEAGAQYLGIPVKWKDLQTTVAGLSQLARLGPWGVLALLVLLASLGSFAAVLAAPADARKQLLGGPATMTLLGVAASLSFALVLTELRTSSPLARLLAGVYALWYLLLPPVLALPRWVALLPAWVLYAVECRRLGSGRRSVAWLVPWAVLLGRLSPVWVKPLWLSVGTWTLAYLAVGWLLWRTRLVELPAERAALFWSMLAVYGWGIGTSPGRFAEALRMGYEALFGFLGLFWMWLAADLVDDASEVAVRLATRLRGTLRRRGVAYGLGATFMVVGGLFAVLAARPGVVVEHLPPPLLGIVGRLFGAAWNEGLVACGSFLLAIGAVTVVRGARTSDPVDVAADGLSAAVLVGLVYWAGAQAWRQALEVEEPSGWWPLVLASAPVLMEEFKQAARVVAGGSGGLTAVAVALLGIATTSFGFASNPGVAVRATTLHPFLGLILWGLPHLLARLLAGWRAEFPSARVFLAGYFSALPAALSVPSLQAGSPALAVLLWPLAIRVVRWEEPPHAGLRLAGGLLLASGTLAFYYAPLFLPIPFVPWTEAILGRLAAVEATEILSRAQLLAWLGSLLVGVTVVFLRGLPRWAVAATVWLVWCRLVV
ncbi:MAG: hypothetical protein RMM30_02170 [Armatimonadota bacterium]|nr:hypothetical protein [Armatimonadota bacterium]MDW8155378.1 hypothetical protein [Armatimonadota bacterium]